MKSLLQFEKEVKQLNEGKGIVVTYSSFNPITKSEGLMLERVADASRQLKYDNLVITNHLQDATAHPFSFHDKVKIMESVYKDLKFDKNPLTPTFIDTIRHLEEQDYDTVHVIVAEESAPFVESVLEASGMEFVIEAFESGAAGREKHDMVMSVINEDSQTFESLLPRQLREYSSTLMKALHSGMKVGVRQLYEDWQEQYNDNFEVGDIVETESCDVCEIVDINSDNNVVICESLINRTLETYRFNELTETTGAVFNFKPKPCQTLGEE